MDMKYSYILGEGSATLVNMLTGKTTTLSQSDSNYGKFISFLSAGNFESAESVGDVATRIETFINEASESNGEFSVDIKNGVATYTFRGQGPYPLKNAVMDRILKMQGQGFDAAPLLRFMGNLLSNPSKVAIDELYLFLESNSLPITEDGCFIAYKIVKADYMDVYTGTISNKIGDNPSMPRFEVDPDRENTCSVGLHFCSKGYLPSYGSHNKSTDRCMLVKVNPADVVTIPSDYKNAKGRAWQYLVVNEMPHKEWRDLLEREDFTSAAVVSGQADAVVPSAATEIMQEVFEDFFYSEDGEVFWSDTDNIATESHVISKLIKKAGCTYQHAQAFYDELVNPSTYVESTFMWERLVDYGFSYDDVDGEWIDDSVDYYRTVDVSDVADATGYSVDELMHLVS